AHCACSWFVLVFQSASKRVRLLSRGIVVSRAAGFQFDIWEQPLILHSPGRHLLDSLAGRRFGTVLADPPWQFQNRTGKVAPEHRRLSRYVTMTFDEIKVLPVSEIVAPV